jgi:glycine/D-amino acid oxidase-like deaminating enzyme
MASSTYPSEVDVLIIGAGPAGLMLATSLSLIDPKLIVRIVDKAEGKVVYGHADGGCHFHLISMVSRRRIAAHHMPCLFYPGYQDSNAEQSRSSNRLVSPIEWSMRETR